MSDQESERSGGTLPGLKKSDLLTRQTGDGSFEFIVESDAVSESYDYEAEPGVSLAAESHVSAGTGNQKKTILIGAAIVVVIALIGAGFAFSNMGDKPAERDAKVMDQEVAGFRPYGGGEAVVRDARPAAPERRARVKPSVPVAAPVEELQDQFVQETYEEEMPSDVVPEREVEWQVGENVQVHEESEEIQAAPMRALSRDRMNLKQVQLQGRDSERIRNVVGREGLRRSGNSRQIERVRRNLQADENVQESFEEELPYEEEPQAFEEEQFEESGSVEEYYEDEEELEEEIY